MAYPFFQFALNRRFENNRGQTGASGTHEAAASPVPSIQPRSGMQLRKGQGRRARGGRTSTP